MKAEHHILLDVCWLWDFTFPAVPAVNTTVNQDPAVIAVPDHSLTTVSVVILRAVVLLGAQGTASHPE